MANWFIKKIKNQFKKLDTYVYNRRLNRLKRGLKYCGINTFIQLPVRFEGSEFIQIGENVSVNAFVHIWGQGGVEIGDNCLIASHVAIVSVTHDINAELYRETVIEDKVTIGNNVWIGTHATILQGVILGDNVIVGAGSVVTKSFPPNVIVAGVPAKIIKAKGDNKNFSS